MIQIIQSFLSALKNGEKRVQREEPSIGDSSSERGPYPERTFNINECEPEHSGRMYGATKSWSEAMVRSNWLFVTNIMLAAGVLLCVFMLLNKQPIIIVRPPVMTGEIRIEDGKPNTDWMLSWAFYAAYQLGNVNPRNVEFVAKIASMILAPNLQMDAEKNIRQLVEVMRASNITQTFTANDVKYDVKSGLVWVLGNKTTRMTRAGSISDGVDGVNDDTRSWTYEFVIRMNHEGMPVITHIDQYSGLPDYQRAASVTPEGLVLEDPRKEKKGKAQEANK